MRPDKTRKQARKEMNDLIENLRKMGFVCIKTMGHYQGGSEQSLFVADTKRKGNLMEVLMHFGKMYEQDTILFKAHGRGSKLIITRGKKFGQETKEAHSTSFGKTDSPNFSKIGGRVYGDVIDVEDDYWPEDEERIMKTFKYEIDENEQADATMNCLKNRNKHGKVQEQEEMSLIDMFDERFKHRSDLRKMANDTTKEAYMIIRNEYGENMWRQLGMDDCDDRGLIDELNWTQENYGITNAQDLADVELGRKSIRGFNKAEEEEEYLTAYDNEDPVWMVINVMRKRGMLRAKGMSGAKGMRYDDGLAIDAAYDLIEQKIEEGSYVYDVEDAMNFVKDYGKEIAEKAMKSGIHNHRKSVNEQEEEKIKLSKSEMEDLAFRLADYLVESFIVLEDQDEQYGDLVAAVEKILEEDVPNPESMRDCYNWCRKWHQKIEGLTYSYYNDPNPLSYYEESEETEFSEALNQIIDNSLGFWDAWEMSKRGQATKKEVEIAGVLLDLFEILMYEGYGEILNKVSSGEIDKRELKRIIVDILLNQDVDTYPRGESQRHSWVRKHNEEIIRRLEDKFRTEEQEEDGINKGGMHNLVQFGHIMNTPSMHDTYDSEWFSNRDEQDAYYEAFRIVAELVADQIDRENDKSVDNDMDVLFEVVMETWKKHSNDLWIYDVDEVDEDDCHDFFDAHYEEIKDEYLKRDHENIMSKTHGDLFSQEKRKIKKNSRSRIVNALVKQLQRYGISMTDKEDIAKASKIVNEILDRTGDYPDLKNFGEMVSWCKEHHREVAKYIYR